ncbi:hypothetical protein [Burkholderia cenocepacia]|uniref:hypothetical protein n=1 Tax=Burkholderia cenocepacia TaxID=95486 RepID=UPI00076162D0|nr:hypothetical protein [Burkholderia cenocepacia]KWU17949.1 hypothetical protein AS149_14845 [Burkholderia cenocepacia]
MREIKEVERSNSSKVCAPSAHATQVMRGADERRSEWEWTLPDGYERPHGEFYLEFGISSHQQLDDALHGSDISLAGQVMHACMLFGYIRRTDAVSLQGKLS